jgi:hypothetical protein
VKQETLKVLADGTLTLTKSTSVGTSAWGLLEYWDFVNTNAAGIGVLLTLVFGLVAIGFNLYNSSKAQHSEVNKKDISDLREDFLTHKEETKEQFETVNSGIERIINNQNNRRKIVRNEDE